jgi:predicted transcriptional regulator
MTTSGTEARSPRPDLYVALRLLEALVRNSNRLSRAALQRAAGINYTLFVRYLELLETRDLVRSSNPGGEVELTAKGYEAYQFLRRGLLEVLGGVAESPPSSRRESP